jgi:hypothetical protein
MRTNTEVRNIRRGKPANAAIVLMPMLIGALACAVTQLSAAPHAHADDMVYTLQRTYAKGDVDHYKVKVTWNSDGTGFLNAKRIIVALTLKEETKELMPDGCAVLYDTFEGGSADVDGKIIEVTTLLPVLTQTRDRQSHILETKSEGGGATTGEMTAMYARQMITFYPSKPAKVGDVQEFSYEDVKAATPTKTKGKWTFAGVETLSGTQTAKIKVVTDMTMETQDPPSGEKATITTHFDGSGNMDLKTGKLVAMSGKITYKGGPFIDGDIVWKLKSADEKDGDKPTTEKKDVDKSGDKKGDH